MITGINLLQTEDFISKYDKGDPQTVWKYGVIDSEAMPVVLEGTQGGTLTQMTELVRFGLKDIQNFTDKDGKTVRYDTEQIVVRGRVFHVLASKILKIIPREIILELGVKILEAGHLTEQETKN